MWKSQVWPRFKLIGDEFFMISISKLIVPLKFPGFLQYVVKLARVFVRYVKDLQEDRNVGSGFYSKPRDVHFYIEIR